MQGNDKELNHTNFGVLMKKGKLKVHWEKNKNLYYINFNKMKLKKCHEKAEMENSS